MQWTAEHEWTLIANTDGSYSFKNIKYGNYLTGDSTNQVLSSSDLGNS